MRTKMSGNDGIVTDFWFNHVQPPGPAASRRSAHDLAGYQDSRMAFHRTGILVARETPAFFPESASLSFWFQFPVAGS